MKKWTIITVITGCLFMFGYTLKPDRTMAIQAAVEKSLPLLEYSSHEFIDNAGCFSCHGQSLGILTFSLAQEKGFATRDTILQEAIQVTVAGMQDRRDDLIQQVNRPGGNISTGYSLWALSAAGYKPDKITSLIAHHLMERQSGEGCWTIDSYRPPLEYSAFTATALAIKGLQAYSAPVFQEQTAKLTANAVSWLSSTSPQTSEERAFQLLGLTWGHASQTTISNKATALLSLQQQDGGWSQLDSLSTDAYATGQSLYALQQSGQLRADQPAYQNGLSFLLRTQLKDGSWKVKSRSFGAVDYIYSGFPHGEHQFISAAGSSWATMALLLALPGADH
jgi:N-acyl-D-amino-acid deacylase